MDLNRKNVKKILLIITFAILLFTASQNLSSVFQGIQTVLKVFSPFVLGFCIAFILNVIMRFFETKVFVFLDKSSYSFFHKLKRPVSLLLSILIILAILVILILLIIPEVRKTILLIATNLPEYMEGFKEWLVDLMDQFHLSSETIQNLNINWEEISNRIMDLLKTNGSSIISTTIEVTSSILVSIINFVLSFVFAIYLLMGKENLLRQCKKVLYSFFSDKNVNQIFYIGTISNKIFSRFLIGQCTEAFILGAMCYVGMLLCGFPYALMISSLMAVTSLIPMIGGFIGTIIGAFLILLVNPLQAVFFVLLILILQQIDSNIFYPKVVGKSIGLPGIWVLAAVTLGSSIGGAAGMLISVPICSVIYCLFREYINSRPAKKVLIKKTKLP